MRSQRPMVYPNPNAYAMNNNMMYRPQYQTPMNGNNRGLFLDAITGALGNTVSGAGGAVGGLLGGAGGAVGGLLGGAGNAASQVVGGTVDGVKNVGEGLDDGADKIGESLGMGDDAGTGLLVGGAAAGAGYMMRKKRQKIHQSKVRMLDQKIAMKEFQANLVDQEYQLLVHANRDLHAANGRVSNLERNAVYRINARILDYAIGAYY